MKNIHNHIFGIIRKDENPQKSKNISIIDGQKKKIKFKVTNPELPNKNKSISFMDMEENVI